MNYCTLQKTNAMNQIRCEDFFKSNNKPGNYKTISFCTNKNYASPNFTKMFTKMSPPMDSLIETTAPNITINEATTSTATSSSDDSLNHQNTINLGDSSGISINVDTSSIATTTNQSFQNNCNSFKTSKAVATSPPEITECFKWLNETPYETTSQSSQSSTTCSHNNVLPTNTDSNLSIYSSKISPLPFPTNHFSRTCSDCVKTTTTTTSDTCDTTSSASSSSGCSSENPHSCSNQYYLNKSNENCKFLMMMSPPNLSVNEYSEINRVKNKRNSLCNDNASVYGKQQFLSYKPALNGANFNTKEANNNNNKSTFRSSKIDFV